MANRPRGRPRRYSEYDQLLTGLPKGMSKRPKYVNSIGVFKGSKITTAWVKVRLPHGGVYKGRSYTRNASLEVKLGHLSSWTWEALEAIRDDLQGKADRNEPLEDEARKLFKDFSKDWLERLKKRTRGHATAEVHLNAHLLQVFGEKALDTIRVQDFNTYIAKRLEAAKPSTVKREIDTLNSILNDAVKGGQLETNPGKHADKIKGIVPRQRFLNADEIVTLLSKAEETAEWLPDFILWCLHSGMRRGEVLDLRWSDIRAVSNDLKIAQVRNSKTDRPRNVVCTDTMKLILERQQGRKAEVGERVFPIAKITLRRKWEATRKEAGLEDVTIHDLRRTHSTQAAAAGVDLRTLAGRLGHSNLGMLEKHYAALVGSASAEAAERIESAFAIGLVEGS